MTPWGFLKGAAANDATIRTQKLDGRSYAVVTWMPPVKAPSGVSYRVNGYINDQHLIERVETWVDHDMFGDLHVDVAYSDYKDFGGLKVPTRIVQKRGGWIFFETSVASAAANPADLARRLQPPAPPAGRGGAPAGAGRGAAPAAEPVPPSTKLADGVYKINGAYNSLAVEFKSYVIVVEGPQSAARGEAVVDEVKHLFPGKPIRYVVNTHPHSDHSSGLAAFIAEGANTIVTYQNNENSRGDVQRAAHARGRSAHPPAAGRAWKASARRRCSPTAHARSNCTTSSIPTRRTCTRTGSWSRFFRRSGFSSRRTSRRRRPARPRIRSPGRSLEPARPNLTSIHISVHNTPSNRRRRIDESRRSQLAASEKDINAEPAEIAGIPSKPAFGAHAAGGPIARHGFWMWPGGRTIVGDRSRRGRGRSRDIDRARRWAPR